MLNLKPSPCFVRHSTKDEAVQTVTTISSEEIDIHLQFRRMDRAN